MHINFQNSTQWYIWYLQIKGGATMLGVRMQTNIGLFQYWNTQYYLNSKFDIGVFVCFDKYAYRA